MTKYTYESYWNFRIKCFDIFAANNKIIARCWTKKTAIKIINGLNKENKRRQNEQL